MKVLVVYDSTWGNTEQIAKAIGGAFEAPDEVRVRRAGSVSPSDLQALDLLIVGAPVQGGRPTKPVQEFISKLSLPAGVKVAAFDTRMPAKWVGIFGFAAPKIAGTLTAKGGKLAAPAEGFYVTGKEGPLQAGELERAAGWGQALIK